MTQTRTILPDIPGATSPAPAPAPYARRWTALVMGAVAMIVVSIDTTVLNVALPRLAADLHATTSQLQWFADAYLLVLAAALLPSGFLSDRLGARVAMILALVIFGSASLACSLAGSPAQLIAARAFLGLGSAIISPLIFAILVVLFEPRERNKAIGVVGGASMIGFPVGPILGGWILQHASWRWVFLINVPLCVLVIVGVLFTFPGRRQRTSSGIDPLGIVLSALGMLTLCYGLIEGPQRGWGDRLVVGALVTAALVIVAFVAWEHRMGSRALMDLRLWRGREFRWGAIAASVTNLLGFAAMFFLPQFLQLIMGYDAIGTGLRQLPLVMAMLLGMFAGLGLASKAGAKVAIGLGVVLLIAGAVLAARTSATSGFGYIALWSALFGVGFGAIALTGQNAAIQQLPKETAGAGSGVMQVVRQIGGVVGIALLPSIFSDVYRRHVETARLPAQVADVVRDSPQAGAMVAQKLHDPALLASVRDAFVAGGAAEFCCAAIMALVLGALVVWRMPNVRVGADAGHGAQ